MPLDERYKAATQKIDPYNRMYRVQSWRRLHSASSHVRSELVIYTVMLLHAPDVLHGHANGDESL